MEALLKAELGTSTLESFGSGGGGCISKGQGYLTDQGKVFVKMNSKPTDPSSASLTTTPTNMSADKSPPAKRARTQDNADTEDKARLMFEGEEASLNAILSTGVIKAPKPIKVVDDPNGGAVLVMEYLDIKSLGSRSAELGTNLARMHLANQELGKKLEKAEGFVHKPDKEDSAEEGGGHVTQFGFHVPTCCGIIPQENTWCDDWVTFYCRHKLQSQIDMIEKEYGDRQAHNLWQRLLPNIPALFEGITVQPALLHGDLWGGNVAETDTEAVIFDAASFYGHNEYELGIAQMFGGFNQDFYNAYHKLIKRQKGSRKRISLYKLFHYLNHWNHFGIGYREQSIEIMRKLVGI